MSQSALFLDRDGVLIEEVGYLSSVEQVRVLDGVAEAIARANAQGIPVVVVTNQAGVGRGYFPESRVGEAHAAIDAALAPAGARIDRYYYCPHHPEAALAEYRVSCECRKPAPGMLRQAAQELDLDLGRSWFVGDKQSDLEAARAAGCQPLLVRTGYGAATERTLRQESAIGGLAIHDDLTAAISFLLANWRGDR